MDSGWRPITELRAGHYAVGLLADGHEVDVYRAGECLYNVATGQKIDGVVRWQASICRKRDNDH